MSEVGKRNLTERDICTKFITPALAAAKWDLMNQIPPPELQASPWLLSPVLDATTRAGKLLGEDF